MALLPILDNYFIPSCVQPPEATNIQDCLVVSINFYANKLTAIAAVVSFAYIVLAGYQMFTAFGDEAKYAQAKKTLLYAVIGLVIALSARFIIFVYVKTLGGSPQLLTPLR